LRVTIADRFRAAFGALTAKSSGAAALPSAGYLPALGSTPSASGLLISQGTAMAVSSVYACVTIISQDVARCTPRLFRVDPATRKRELVTDHPVAKFFRAPNPYQTWFEFCEQMTAAEKLRGNAYAVRRHDGRGRFMDMIPVNPDAVLVLESFDGQIFYNVNRIGLWQIAMLRDFPSSIAAEDMFHLRGLSFNSLVALSTIGVARDAVGLAMGLEQQASRFMQNGSRPSVLLQTKGRLTEEAAKRLKQQWRDLTAGIQGVGQTAVLEEGIEAKPLQLTSVDLEFMAQRNFGVADISRFYRVPPFKLGLDGLRGVNIDQVNQDYVNNTIMPELHRWEQKLAQVFDLDAQGLEVSFDETALLRADITTRYAAARIALGGAAFATLNEVRAGEGWPDIPGGDEVTRPVNVATVGSDKTGTAPDGAGRPAASEGGVPGADHVPPAPSASRAAQADNEEANSVQHAAEVLAKAGLAI
jgi:HK97 family phage portal protein